VPRWTACAVATLAFLVIGATAGPAFANTSLYIHLYNRMSTGEVALVARGGEICWEQKDLARSADQNAVAPGKVKTLHSENKNPLFTSCNFKGGSQGLEFKLKEPGGGWYVPAGFPGDYYVMTNKSNPSEGFAFGFQNGVGTWVPRADGRGFVCFHTVLTSYQTSLGGPWKGEADIYVYNDRHCNIGVPVATASTARWSTQAEAERRANTPAARAPPERTARVAGPLAGAAQAGSNEGAITDLLSTVGVLCPWYAYPGQTARCNGYNPGDGDAWSIGNVAKTVQFRHFKVTKDVAENTPKSLVGSATLPVPEGYAPGTVGVNQSVGVTSSTTSSTTHGFRVGFKFVTKQGVMVVFAKSEFSQEFSFDYNFAKTDAETTGGTQMKQVSITAGAAPGYTTRLDVYTVDRKIHYEYKADLDFGSPDGKPLDVTTPANLALDQSPARRQPCLAYVVGARGVRNSIMDIGSELLAAGFSPDESSLPPARRAFLASVRYWRAGPATCAGFPGEYASEAGFTGDGVGMYENFGADDKGRAATVMTGCIFRTPYAGGASSPALLHNRLEPPTARPAAGSAPCQSVPINGGRVDGVQPGTLVDASNARPVRGSRDAAAITAPPGSDEILGPNAGGAIYTNNGALDIVRAGRGNTRIVGGSGENHLYGGPGNDTLIGGRLGTNYLYAGTGGTTLEQSNGYAQMYGGPGVDNFLGRNMSGVMAGGSGPNRMVATGNMSRLQMLGGSGPNVYILRGNGAPTILQPPGRGASTLETDLSIRVPMYVKRAVAIGSRPVVLTGSFGTRSLQANNAGDKLVSGPGAELMRGGRGPDTIVFNDENDDVARGGTGADRYVFTGTPERFTRPPSLQYPALRTAAKIIGFNPRKGDRLVLARAVFGPGLARLKRRFRIVAGRNPRPAGPGATLLFNTRTRILSFDPDGSGPISDKVIVRLPGFRTVKRSWIQFTK
jgi:Ca2+-binding RTX toxin-like protein